MIDFTTPVASIDIESTGLDVEKDRIIELAIVTIDGFGEYESSKFRFNPGMPIPAESSEIHKIYDEDVAQELSFSTYAHEIFQWLKDSLISGFNIINFDIPILQNEFKRCGIEWAPHKVLDTATVMRKLNKRSLKWFCELYGVAFSDEEYHSADYDALKSLELLQKAQEDHIVEVGTTEDEIYRFAMGDNIDLAGKIVWKDGKAVFNFGMNKGKPVIDHSSYVDWMLKQDTFTPETKYQLMKILGR